MCVCEHTQTGRRLLGASTLREFVDEMPYQQLSARHWASSPGRLTLVITTRQHGLAPTWPSKRCGCDSPALEDLDDPHQYLGVQDRERKRQKLADASADAYIGADVTNGGAANVVSPAAEEPVKPQVWRVPAGETR